MSDIVIRYIVNIFDILAVILSIILVYKSIRKIMKKNNTEYFIQIIFFIFFVLPVALDYIIYPTYETWPQFMKFAISYKDPTTRILYDIWIVIAQCLIIYFGKNKTRYESQNSQIHEKIKNKWVLNLLFLLGIFPVVVVLLTNIPNSILYKLFWRENVLLELQIEQSYKTLYYLLERFSYISIVSCFLYITNAYPKKNLLIYKIKNFLLKSIAFISFLALICLESKRAIYAIVLLMIMTQWILVTKFSKRKYVIGASIIVTTLFILYCSSYILLYRNYNVNYDTANLYTQLKMDLTRDDRVKLVIYSLINPGERKILDYPFQSYIMQIGSFFPLEFLGVPYLGYNTFFSSALLDVEAMIGANNFSTTSCFDEMIANFGVVGAFLGPIIIGNICNIINKFSIRLRIISVVGIVLLMTLPINYIAWYIQFWIFIMICDRKKIRFIW